MHDDGIHGNEQDFLAEIDQAFSDLTYRQRLGRMFSGLVAAHDSRAYKEAHIELQRTAAPMFALVLPFFLVLLLLAFTGKVSEEPKIYEATVEEIQAVDDLTKIEEIPPPEPPDYVPDNLSEVLGSEIKVDTPVANTSDPTPSVKPVEITAVSMIKSPVVFKGIYGSLRNSGVRGSALATHGGDANTEAAVMRALRWLKTQQQPNGAWKGGATGLALLAYLAHGERPGDSSPEFGDTVQKAIEYLCAHAKNLDYFTTYALAEAYGMTLHPGVRDAAYTAIEKTISKQFKNGQWGNGDKPELLQMTFNVLSLKAAKMAGLKVPGLDESMKLAVNGFMLQGNADRGGFQSDAFGPPGANFRRSGTWHFMMGVFGMQYLGAGNETVVSKTLKLLDSLWPPATLGKNDIACCPVRSNYYSTMVYFNAGGERWNRWNNSMKKIYCDGQTIIKGQYKDHNGVEQELGYWNCEDEHIGDQPLMPTVYIAQQLMIYYRFLPSTTKKAWETGPEAATALVDKSDIDVDTSGI